MNYNKIYQGDALEVLKTFPDECVNCVVTSPPYWGLRDYGTATWEGGDADCDHKVGRFTTPHSNKQGSNAGSGDVQAKNTCPKCGAKRIDQQLGLEKTPEEYVSKLVEIFREIRRVLKKDGTVWLNLGDCYAGSGKAQGQKPEHKNCGKIKQKRGYDVPEATPSKEIGLKPKDLVGIPWMVAFALRDDGWWLRQDIIWSKKNPMPESVTDRCTKAHEYIFLLTKSAKYYYDADAIKEKATQIQDYSKTHKAGNKRNPTEKVSGFRPRESEAIYYTSNKRSVWTVTTKPFREAHFAVFPEKLIKPCILAGCPKDGIVLDPFIGSGTTAIMARKIERNYMGIELNPDYIKIAEKRMQNELGLFA